MNPVEKPRSGLGAKSYFVAKSLARRARWLPHDLARILRGRDPLEPPLGISFVGHGDFKDVGEWFAAEFAAAGMESDDRVLDIGCGIGRMAIPLLNRLEYGSYEGFDTSATMIKWCQRHITATDPSFRFKHAPIHNRKYNPFGSVKAVNYRFPYEDATFDFAFATSVFTHLGLAETRHYLGELARVLAPGGTALVTFFLIGGDGRPDTGRCKSFDFAYEFGSLRTIDPKEPEAAVAYPETLLIGMLREVGLEMAQPIIYGRWPMARVGHDIQDRLVLRRSS